MTETVEETKEMNHSELDPNEDTKEMEYSVTGDNSDNDPPAFNMHGVWEYTTMKSTDPSLRSAHF